MYWDWILVLTMVFGNIIGTYLFTSTDKKDEEVVHAWSGASALLGSFCLAKLAVARLMVSGISFDIATTTAMILTYGFTYWAIRLITWRLCKGLLRR